jgi:hypothetical protein
MNFYLYFPHFSGYLGEIPYEISSCNAVQRWWVSWESAQGEPRFSDWLE